MHIRKLETKRKITVIKNCGTCEIIFHEWCQNIKILQNDKIEKNLLTRDQLKRLPKCIFQGDRKLTQDHSEKQKGILAKIIRNLINLNKHWLFKTRTVIFNIYFLW